MLLLNYSKIIFSQQVKYKTQVHVLIKKIVGR